MARAIILNGGSSFYSDELSAYKSNILSTRDGINITAIGADTIDEISQGTMPNRGNIVQKLNLGSTYTIPEGFHTGSGYVYVQTIKDLTSDATGTAKSILEGYTGWVNGEFITGEVTLG